jgi:hypothetical protein
LLSRLGAQLSEKDDQAAVMRVVSRHMNDLGMT